MLPNTYTQGAQRRLTHVLYFESLKVWQSWVKLAHHPPPPPSRTSLCPRVWHTHTHLPASSALQPHTPARAAGRVSCFSGDATSDQWAAVRTVRERGGNSPPIAPLSTWEPTLPQGGAPSRPLSEWTPNKNSHQQVSYTSQCWFFCSLLFFPPPSFFFSFMAGTLLYILARLKKKKKGHRERNKTVKVWELFLVPFFFFQELLAVLTLLTQVFVHLWHWISGSASSLCAKISTVSYFLVQISDWKHI